METYFPLKMPLYRLGYLDVEIGESQELNEDAVAKIIKQSYNIPDVNVNITFPMQNKSVFYIASAIVAINMGVTNSESLDEFISNYPELFQKVEDAKFTLVRYIDYINSWKE